MGIIDLFLDRRFLKYYVVLVGAGYLLSYLTYPPEYLREPAFHFLTWFVGFWVLAIWYSFKIINEKIKLLTNAMVAMVEKTEEQKNKENE